MSLKKDLELLDKVMNTLGPGGKYWNQGETQDGDRYCLLGAFSKVMHGQDRDKTLNVGGEAVIAELLVKKNPLLALAITQTINPDDDDFCLRENVAEGIPNVNDDAESFTDIKKFVTKVKKNLKALAT